MTTYAPTFTPRYRLKYRAAGILHTVQVRAPRGASTIDVDDLRNPLGAIFVALQDSFADDVAYVSAELAQMDDEVFIPATLPSDVPVGAIDVATWSPVAKITGLTFSGRAPGSRARFTLFGILLRQDTSTGFGSDGIVLPSEVPAIATVAANASGNFVANSGSPAVFYNQATYKPNDHLLKLVRRGIIM